MPIYQRLSTNELLKRCITGGTQNDNETFHRVLWSRCPKQKFCGHKKVVLAAYQAVSLYNCGMLDTLTLQMRKMGVCVSPSAKHFFHKTDRKRMHDNVRKAVNKSRRILLRRQHVQEEEQRIAEEGVSYASGSF